MDRQGKQKERSREPGSLTRPALVRASTRDDWIALQGGSAPRASYTTGLRSLEELLERDRLRELDGFPRKVRVGRLIKPGKGGGEKLVIVPTTVEEKLLHDTPYPPESSSSGGSGEGTEGEVIGEEGIRDETSPGEGAPNRSAEGSHELEANAYELGRILTEKFQLPNLKDKGKKRFLRRTTYDLTDRHRGAGQILDKKATLRRILATNIGLGRVGGAAPTDPARLLIVPGDKVYRVLSLEKDYDSQAVVFFIRDYSGSMAGKATELVVSQHVLLYSWLLYQYGGQVETRFILHDTEAREVADFTAYYNLKTAGGTQVLSAYQLVNRIVRDGSLARDYNIYIFHGTDGDDTESDAKETVEEMKRILGYASRVGITIAGGNGSGEESVVQKLLKDSRLLSENPALLRLDVLNKDADESRLIEGIRQLIS